MSRTVKVPEVRRKELLEIALSQFLEKGYEKTSIRSIVKEAGGEIGMFYHYFTSKNEIYEACLEYYNQKYVAEVAGIINMEAGVNERISQIINHLSKSITEYRLMNTDKVNPEIRALLHLKTLLKIAPLFEKIIVEGIEKGNIRLSVLNAHLISKFILFGMSAVIHDEEVGSMDVKCDNIRVLLHKVLDIEI